MKTAFAAALLISAALAGAAQAQGRPRYDLDGDGKVTPAEFRAVQVEQTMKLDRDKDGRVTREETRALETMAKTLGGQKAGARIATLWRLADANNDGAITRAEAAAAADRRFPVYDLDKNGALSAVELEAVRKRSPAAK